MNVFFFEGGEAKNKREQWLTMNPTKYRRIRYISMVNMNMKYRIRYIIMVNMYKI